MPYHRTTLAARADALADVQAYGVTRALLEQELPRLGIQVSLVDACDPEAVRAAWQPNTWLLHVETLSNPLLTLPDIPALAERAHQHGALLSVDNTFASPALFRPAEHGADLVTHSLSKYLSGHSTAFGGVICGREALIAQARAQRLEPPALALERVL